jgi:hypothetical protein
MTNGDEPVTLIKTMEPSKVGRIVLVILLGTEG